MTQRYEAPGWQDYKMDFKKPFLPIEPVEDETAVVKGALGTLVECGILPHTDYPTEGLAATRAAMEAKFEIPWTAIAPRLHRLIYAINAIKRRKTMVAVGVFCGFTFFSRTSSSVGASSLQQAHSVLPSPSLLP